MENTNQITYREMLSRDWRKAVIVGLSVLLATLIFTLVQPFLFSATASVLVIQKAGPEAYTTYRSAALYAGQLGAVLDSSEFFDKVMNAGFDIDKTYFPADEAKKREKWGKTVSYEVPSGSSELQITVYHTEPNQAMQISEAVLLTLISDKKEYLESEDVELKMLDAPLVSKYPVKPNVALNLILGVVLGFLIGIGSAIATFRPVLVSAVSPVVPENPGKETIEEDTDENEEELMEDEELEADLKK
jgi:succinoglycan biosynthesis transport protein ExoP